MPPLLEITYSDFVQTVTENDGEELHTAGNLSKFRLELTSHGASFTPLKTGKSRPLNQNAIQRYLDKFNEENSLVTSDYTDKMVNASYVLAIIKLWKGQRPDALLIDDGTSGTIPIDPCFGAPEGDPTVVLHRRRERSRELVTMAKQLFRMNHGNRLFCEVCEFDFGAVYGAPDFIEAHHKIPLRDLKPDTKTKLSDLVMVCANCHRMLHRGNPWPTLAELKQKVAAAKV